MIWLLRRLVCTLMADQPMPKHVAFIMDGNRRFADQLNLQRIDGHAHGYNQMKQIIQWCIELGVQYISVYAFSIDNFKRPKEEVDSLMQLALAKFEELLHDEDAQQWQAELRVIGDLSRAPADVQAAAARLMQGSLLQGPPRAVVNICFSYTSTQELQHAVSQVCSGLQQSELLPDDITPNLLHNVMHTRDCPPVDLLVRTSGEQRLSDYLLWQCSHALLHWEPCLWPEFGYVQLLKAVLAWQKAQPQLSALRQASTAAIACAGGVQQQQQQQEDSWAAGLSSSRCSRCSSLNRLQSPELVIVPQLEQQQQQQQEAVHRPQMERAISLALSSITEDDEVCCPHPSQQFRVQGFLRRVEGEYLRNVQALAADSQ